MAQLFHADCLDVMPGLQAQSIDLILADLPYGTTACTWDAVIPFEPLWVQYRRLLKPNGSVVLSATQPFTTDLIASNRDWFKYEWIYEKTNPKGFLSARNRPLTAHENILVFSKGLPTYNPQKWQIPEHLRTKRKHATSKTSGEVYGDSQLKRWDDDGSRFPTSVIGFSNRVGRSENYHPTQKPIALMEYLIQTHTNPGEIVLDNCMGSGTTGVAALRLERQFIGIERERKYFDIAEQRISGAIPDTDLFATSSLCSHCGHDLSFHDRQYGCSEDDCHCDGRSPGIALFSQIKMPRPLPCPSCGAKPPAEHKPGCPYTSTVSSHQREAP